MFLFDDDKTGEGKMMMLCADDDVLCLFVHLFDRVG